PDRLRAIEALGALGPPAASAVPTLALALKGKDLLRLRAAEALGRIGPLSREAAPDLERLLSDPDLLTQARAAIALREVGCETETAVDVLIEALRSPVFRSSLAQPRPTAETSPIPSFTTNRRTNIFGRVVFDPPSSLPVSPSFRREIIETLGRMKGQARKAVPALREATKEADSATRMAAAKALEAIDPAAGATGVEAQ
ncbi:HEAT repeat domain-containing protein, partial [Singulisphaera acidiphila]